MTSTEIKEQQERFETFLEKANLVKIGEKLFEFRRKNNQDGRYNDYVYLLRVLGIVPKVKGSMYYPKQENHQDWKSYREILEYHATVAFLDKYWPKKN